MRVGAGAGSSGNTELRSYGQTRCYAPANEIYQTVGHVGHFLKNKNCLRTLRPRWPFVRALPPPPNQKHSYCILTAHKLVSAHLHL